MAAAESKRRPRSAGPSAVTRPRDKELSKRKNRSRVHIYSRPMVALPLHPPPDLGVRGPVPVGGGWGWLAVLPPFLQSSAQPQFHPASLHGGRGDRRRCSQVSLPTLSSAEARVEPASSRDLARPLCLAAPGPSQQQLGLVWSGCVPSPEDSVGP